MKLPHKYRMYDVMHKSVVSVLIGFTAVSSAWLAYKGFHWYTVKRPALVAEYRRNKEEKIALEQAAFEKEMGAEKGKGAVHG